MLLRSIELCTGPSPGKSAAAPVFKRSAECFRFAAGVLIGNADVCGGTLICRSVVFAVFYTAVDPAIQLFVHGFVLPLLDYGE